MDAIDIKCFWQKDEKTDGKIARLCIMNHDQYAFFENFGIYRSPKA